MPNLDDNQKQSVQGQNNWTDNLLVKDKAGKLHPLKGAGVPEVAPDLPVKVDEKKVGATATPLNDNFIPVQYSTTGRSDDTAIFAFHPDDKDQLDNIAKEMPSDDSKKYSIDKIVDKLIEKQQLKFDSENKDKFIDILYQYFRNRRKAPVIREILSTKILSDKKKLAEQLVDNILSIIKGIKAKIEAEGGLVVMQNAMPPLPVLPSQDEEPVVIPPEPKVNIVEDEFADVEGNIEVDEEIKKALFEIEKIEDEPLAVVTPPKLDPESKEEEVKEDDEVKSIPIKKPEFKIAKKPEQSQREEKLDLIKPKVLKKEPPVKEIGLESLPKVIRPGQSTPVKKQMDDVLSKAPAPVEVPTPISPVPSNQNWGLAKPEPKYVLSGPVQELQDMSFRNFRRSGNTAQERVDKILDKISILEQDSYTKKSQGIEAWRRSETYKLYLALGAESMIEGKKIEEVVKEKEDKGESVLDGDEFSAISDLNKKLRF